MQEPNVAGEQRPIWASNLYDLYVKPRSADRLLHQRGYVIYFDLAQFLFQLSIPINASITRTTKKRPAHIQIAGWNHDGNTLHQVRGRRGKKPPMITINNTIDRNIILNFFFIYDFDVANIPNGNVP